MQDYFDPTNHLATQLFSFLEATGPGAVREVEGIRSLRTEQHHLAICALPPTRHTMKFKPPPSELQNTTGRKGPVYKQTGSGKLRVYLAQYPMLIHF